MRTGKLTRFVTQNLQRNRKNLVFSGIGIVVGIVSFTFFIALGYGANEVVATRIFPLDANRLQVVPRTTQFGSLAEGRILDDAVLTELSRLPGVNAVYPRMKLSVLTTMSLEGDHIPQEAVAMLGKVPGITPAMLAGLKQVRMWMEIMVTGLDPRLVKPDVLTGDFRDPPPGEPIPALLSRRMIEIYNTSFAKARGLPRLSELVIPFLPPFPLTVNHSFISRDVSGSAMSTRIKLTGLSHHALMGGISLPLDTVRRWNREYLGARAAQAYDGAIVEVSSSDRLGPVQQEIQRMGFDIDLGEKRMAESVGFAVTLVTLGFTLISLIIVGIAAINMAHTFFMIIYERKREIGLLRALGATRADVRSLILAEASFLGAVGGLLGTGLGTFMCWAMNRVAGSVLPDFPFKPDRFFVLPWWLPLSGITFAILFCAIGAYFPARRAARLDPASTLTGR